MMAQDRICSVVKLRIKNIHRHSNTRTPKMCRVLLKGLVSLPDGSLVHRTNGSCPSISEAISLGKSLGKELKERAGGDFFQKMVEMSPQMEK